MEKENREEKSGIFVDYLSPKRSEVTNMLREACNYGAESEVQRDGEYEEDEEKGGLEDRKKLIKDLYNATFTIEEISMMLKMGEGEIEKIVKQKE